MFAPLVQHTYQCSLQLCAHKHQSLTLVPLSYCTSINVAYNDVRKSTKSSPNFSLGTAHVPMRLPAVISKARNPYTGAPLVQHTFQCCLQVCAHKHQSLTLVPLWNCTRNNVAYKCVRTSTYHSPKCFSRTTQVSMWLTAV